MKTIITHSGNFHTDDVFAVATTLLYLEKRGEIGKVIRTFEPDWFKKGDFVMDIGLISDQKKNKFDHHQQGGAGTRPNGIPHASFGLVWRKFGKTIAGSQALADEIDSDVITYIDADDNGVTTYKPLMEGVKVFTIDEYISLEADTIKGTDYKDKKAQYKAFDLKFKQLVAWAQTVIKALVKNAEEKIKAKKQAKKLYDAAENKRIIVMKTFVPYSFSNFPEPLITIYPDMRGGWSAKTVKIKGEPLKGRIDFPKSWWGKSETELQKVSGVSDARFCHNSGFLAVAESVEGAIKLAEKALRLN